MSLSRDFKGIWIPKEIWLHPKLSIQAKTLWAEIDSLYNEKRGGCFAKDEYLCDFLQIKTSRLHEILKELKDLGLIEKVSFDGRERILKAIRPKDVVDGNQGSGKPETTQPENRNPDNDFPKGPPIYENKDKNVVKEGVDVVHKKNSTGSLVEIRKSDIFAQAEREGKDWTIPEFKRAWQALIDCPAPISDGYKYFVGTIRNFREQKSKTEKMNNPKAYKPKGETQCYTKRQNGPGSFKEKSLDLSSKETVYDLLLRQQAEKKNSGGG